MFKSEILWEEVTTNGFFYTQFIVWCSYLQLENKLAKAKENQTANVSHTLETDQKIILALRWVLQVSYNDGAIICYYETQLDVF